LLRNEVFVLDPRVREDDASEMETIVMTFLKILLIAAMVATVGALVLGLLSMSKEGKEAGERSNRLMRYRIFFQALAILIFSLLIFFKVK
jgi:hypothetical protein